MSPTTLTPAELTAVVRLKLTTPTRSAAVHAALAHVPPATDELTDRVAVLMGGGHRGR